MWCCTSCRKRVNFSVRSEEVKKYTSYKNITFYVSDGPSTPEQVTNYLQDLRDLNVKLVIRSNNFDHGDAEEFAGNGIELMDISFMNFQIPIPSVMKRFCNKIGGYYVEQDKVAILIQGYDQGPFLAAYALQLLGMNLRKSMKMMRDANGSCTLLQGHFLRQRMRQLEMDRVGQGHLFHHIY